MSPGVRSCKGRCAPAVTPTAKVVRAVVAEAAMDAHRCERRHTPG
ncbi:hypothetical protein FM125_10165 [Micrococcus lylae]|uniref:Uncharacterized protein n=1 Tax=Micrococcus lylae TaxID=1273 RepID=A0A1R4JRI8_9MICC|nr:hypothetical protein FM125_10165 [Micrococcus lylae]